MEKRKLRERYNFPVGILSALIIAVIVTVATYSMQEGEGYNQNMAFSSFTRIINLVVSMQIARYFSKEMKEKRAQNQVS